MPGRGLCTRLPQGGPSCYPGLWLQGPFTAGWPWQGEVRTHEHLGEVYLTVTGHQLGFRPRAGKVSFYVLSCPIGWVLSYPC